VACCGIDEAANHALFEAVTARLGRSGPTVGIAATLVESDAEGVRPSPGVPLARGRTWPRALGWLFRTGGLDRGNKFAEMVERARVDEALEDGRKARFVVGDGNPLVDLLAWAEADFYSGVFDERGLQQIFLYLTGERRVPLSEWPRFIRRAPEVWLLNRFDLAHPPAPDVLVVTTADVESDGPEPFSVELQEAYLHVGAALAKRHVEVIVRDRGAADLAATVDRIESSCLRLAREPARAT